MKKLLSKLPILLAVSLMLVACESKDEAEMELSREETRANPYRVPLEDALANADFFIRSVDNSTRSSRRVKSVDYYLNPNLTRSDNDADTLLYIVNYENDEGFAIMGADKRLLPVYGFSNEGNLNMADTIQNKGLALCLENIRYSAS